MYSDLKKRVKIMRKYGFSKLKGGPYRRIYNLGPFQKGHAMGVEAVASHINLEDYLRWIESQAMKELKAANKGKHSRTKY